MKKQFLSILALSMATVALHAMETPNTTVSIPTITNAKRGTIPLKNKAPYPHVHYKVGEEIVLGNLVQYGGAPYRWQVTVDREYLDEAMVKRLPRDLGMPGAIQNNTRSYLALKPGKTEITASYLHLGKVDGDNTFKVHVTIHKQ